MIFENDLFHLGGVMREFEGKGVSSAVDIFKETIEYWINRFYG